ncbi:hypothetical protein TNCV_2763541, partial [Trichonephila clavipes]
MTYYYGTTHKNAINCSSMDWKTLREFLSLVRSAYDDLDNIIKHPAKRVGNGQHYTEFPSLKYPKVMTYYYGTTHKNAINCSSMDWKTLREFLSLVRSAYDDLDNIIKHPAKRVGNGQHYTEFPSLKYPKTISSNTLRSGVGNGQHYTEFPSLKYPKVMTYYYGTTHKNAINCSSMDWKTLREFLSLVRSAYDDLDNIIKHPAKRVGNGQHYTEFPSLKYPKVMTYYYGTTHKNAINCSSMDWKTLREFLSLVRSAYDDLDNIIKHPAKRVGNGQHYTEFPSLKYPKVLTYYYGTTHKNAINCSSMDWKTLREFSSSSIG